MLGAADALRLQECVTGGGVALFPADTVYGLGCDPESEEAVERLYAIKGRPADRPAAVMFFSIERALERLSGLSEMDLSAVRALLPGPVTLLLRNPAHRFALACGPDPGTLGLRVPRLDAVLAPLAAVMVPLMQSSANLSGGAEARRLEDVPAAVREAVDLELDAGERPGVPSTVIDLREWGRERRFAIVREGAMSEQDVVNALAAVGGGW